MNTKHTPGPWSTQEGYDRESGLKLTRVLFGASIVAECYGINSAANARLIASAPDLLAVLTEIVGQQNPNRYGYDAAHKAMDDDWRTRARAAIAKATGENQ